MEERWVRMLERSANWKYRSLAFDLTTAMCWKSPRSGDGGDAEGLT